MSGQPFYPSQKVRVTLSTDFDVKVKAIEGRLTKEQIPEFNAEVDNRALDLSEFDSARVGYDPNKFQDLGFVEVVLIKHGSNERMPVMVCAVEELQLEA